MRGVESVQMVDWKKIMKGLGYYNECKECGHKWVSWSRFIGEVIFVSSFAIILFFYLTVELPALKEYHNCTYQMQVEATRGIILPIINNTNDSSYTISSLPLSQSIS